MKQTDITIIGAGPVGIFAVFQAGMLGMRCVVIDALESLGGQCTTLYPEKPIYDIPSQPKITGAELIKQLIIQAEPFNPTYLLNQIAIKIDKQQDNYFLITTSQNVIIKSKIILIAAGAGCFVPNKPPLPHIEDFEGISVFYSVQRPQDFTGKNVVIAGGGDSAIDWAIALSELAKKVYIVHRRNKFRAALSSVNKVDDLSKQGKIELVLGYQLTNLIGTSGKLESVLVSDLDNNTKVLDANVLLPFFGLVQDLGPINTFGLKTEAHRISVDAHCQTNIPGIYAIGDVATYHGKLKLILTGFAEAANSVHHAYSTVFNGKALHFQYSTTKGIPSN